jgi:hypothetical protein
MRSTAIDAVIKTESLAWRHRTAHIASRVFVPNDCRHFHELNAFARM